MAGLPTIPGLPPKPVHTNLPPTKKELAGLTAAKPPFNLGSGLLPPWRQRNRLADPTAASVYPAAAAAANNNQRVDALNYDDDTPVGSAASAAAPSSANKGASSSSLPAATSAAQDPSAVYAAPGPELRDVHPATPRAANQASLSARYAARESTTTTTTSSTKNAARDFSARYAAQGPELRDNHSTSRAEPSTAAPARRAENPFSIRPDRGQVRGASKAQARLPRHLIASSRLEPVPKTREPKEAKESKKPTTKDPARKRKASPSAEDRLAPVTKRQRTTTTHDADYAPVPRADTTKSAKPTTKKKAMPSPEDLPAPVSASVSVPVPVPAPSTAKPTTKRKASPSPENLSAAPAPKRQRTETITITTPATAAPVHPAPISAPVPVPPVPRASPVPTGTPTPPAAPTNPPGEDDRSASAGPYRSGTPAGEVVTVTPPMTSPARMEDEPAVLPPPVPVPPTVLSTSDDAAYIEVVVDAAGAARLFLVDASVLEGFSTWWSGQAPDEPAYELDLGGVFAAARQEVNGEEVVMEVLGRILEMMHGGQRPPADGWRLEHIWLAGLMHGVLGLPLEVREELKGGMGVFCGGVKLGWEGGEYVVKGGELEKGVAACLVFGWENHWRELVRVLGRVCAKGEGGRVVMLGVGGGEEMMVAEEICGRSALDLAIAVRGGIVHGMTHAAMDYLHTCMVDASGATCRSAGCAASRIGAVYTALQAAGLYPWPKANGPGRSVDEIVTVLEKCCQAAVDLSIEGRMTPDPIGTDMAGPCSGCAERVEEANYLHLLRGLYMPVVFGVGEKLVRDMEYPGAL